MRIQKGTTPEFDSYDVISVASRRNARRFLGFTIAEYDSNEEIVLPDVVEADDKTGLVVQHMRNSQGELLYTNGKDDIAIDNSARLLLLVPPVRAAFVAAGFVPKLVNKYLPGVRIWAKKPVVAPEEPTKQLSETTNA